jgi:hypothetical protein
VNEELNKQIEEAKKILFENGFMVIKWDDGMNEDAERCSNGEAISCSECSCHVCTAGQY